MIQPPSGLVPQNPAPAAPSQVTGGRVIKILLAACLAIVFAGAVVVFFVVRGTRGFLQGRHLAEGEKEVPALASGIIRCSQLSDPKTGARRGLPPTSRAVPATFAEVSGKLYQSLKGEWNDEAFTCAGFERTAPQYFQYRWERLAPTRGRAVGVADLDGDGTPDARFEQEVRCNDDGSCGAGKFVANRP
ncbi:MAG TPA: hypothetical protein VGK73_21540 [Polyangiaceae bacterium]